MLLVRASFRPYAHEKLKQRVRFLSRVVSLVVDGSGPFLQNVLTHANSTLLPYYGNNFMEIIWWNYLMQIIWLNCFVKSLDWIIQWNHLMESFHNIKASEYYRRLTIWSAEFFHCVTFSDKQIGTIIVWLNAGKQNCGFCICYIVFKAVGSSWLSCIFFNQSQLMMFDKHENMGKFLKNVSCMSRDFRRSWMNLILTLTENETGLTFFSNS